MSTMAQSGTSMLALPPWTAPTPSVPPPRSDGRCGVLILTGRGDTIDRVMGLELGADDYMVKPFEPRELIARVRTILRRCNGRGTDTSPLPPATVASQRRTRAWLRSSTW